MPNWNSILVREPGIICAKFQTHTRRGGGERAAPAGMIEVNRQQGLGPLAQLTEEYEEKTNQREANQKH